jgi:hypothetical protein
MQVGIREEPMREAVLSALITTGFSFLINLHPGAPAVGQENLGNKSGFVGAGGECTTHCARRPLPSAKQSSHNSILAALD